MLTTTVRSLALLCLWGWWSSFQSVVAAAMPCTSYTKLVHAPSLHFPKQTYSFVQLTECIDSAISDITEAEFIRPP